MEILSNWGNASWVGLTEVQFFDLNNIKLYVSPHDVDIRNAVLPGELGCLVNRDLVVSDGFLGLVLLCILVCVLCTSEGVVLGWGRMLSSTLVFLCSQVRKSLWEWYRLKLLLLRSCPMAALYPAVTTKPRPLGVTKASVIVLQIKKLSWRLACK